MSADDVRRQISQIHTRMAEPLVYEVGGEIRNLFLKDLNLLQQEYGEYVGRAKAKHVEFSDEIERLEERTTECFAALTRTSNSEDCFKVVNVATQSICQLVSFVETLETEPAQEKVTKKAYEQLVDENKALKKAFELVRSLGLPELNSLLESARKVGLETDENWVLALCSANLIEAVVNRKLEKMSEKIEGNFENRYKRLCRVIKERENRDISQLLPLALYNGIRNKLDHASHSNKVTSKEAKDVSELVEKFINEVFQ